MTAATTLIATFAQANPGCGAGCGAATAAAAATGADHSVWPLVRLAAVVLPVWFAGYMLACQWFRFGRCGRCKGAGVLADSSGKHFRTCPRCKGIRPLRFGRRLYLYLRRLQKESS